MLNSTPAANICRLSPCVARRSGRTPTMLVAMATCADRADRSRPATELSMNNVRRQSYRSVLGSLCPSSGRLQPTHRCGFASKETRWTRTPLCASLVYSPKGITFTPPSEVVQVKPSGWGRIWLSNPRKTSVFSQIPCSAQVSIRRPQRCSLAAVMASSRYAASAAMGGHLGWVGRFPTPAAYRRGIRESGSVGFWPQAQRFFSASFRIWSPSSPKPR